MAVADILSNPKYPDDMILTVADGITFKVGEIRALPVAERVAVTAEVDKRNKTLEQAELAFAAKMQQAEQAGWLTRDAEGKYVIAPRPQQQQSHQQQQQPQPTVEQLRAAAQVEYNLDDNDPLLGPVVKAMRAELAKRDTALAEVRTKLDALPSQLDSLKTTLTDSLGRVTGVVNTSVGRYLNDTYQSQFAAATKDLPAGVKVNYEDAFKYATEHGLKDKDGFLQVSEAVDRLTWNDRKKAELDKERADLIAKTTRELEDKNKLATLTPPSSRNPLQANPTKDGEFKPYKERTDSKGNKVHEVKTFEEAMSEAMSDEDVLKSALGTASFGGNIQ
jgi:hypothetical protein